jgi:hypothetical protein
LTEATADVLLREPGCVRCYLRRPILKPTSPDNALVATVTLGLYRFD